MQNVLASVAQLAGIVSLVAAGFVVGVVVGLVVLGLGLLVVGAALDPSLGKR